MSDSLIRNISQLMKDLMSEFQIIVIYHLRPYLMSDFFNNK